MTVQPVLLEPVYPVPARRQPWTPPDTEEAWQKWGANCGPCALAAILGLRLVDVAPHFDGFSRRRYMNPTDVKAALDRLHVQHRVTRDWPEFGLAFLQWEGPWRHISEAYRHTHWVAVNGIRVYDVNEEEGWTSKHDWERWTVPYLLTCTPEATGWSVRTALVLPRPAR